MNPLVLPTLISVGVVGALALSRSKAPSDADKLAADKAAADKAAADKAADKEKVPILAGPPGSAPAPVRARCKVGSLCHMYFDPRKIEGLATFLPLGAKAEVLVFEAITNPADLRNGWSRVRSTADVQGAPAGTEGWIRTDNLDILGPAPSAAPSAAAGIGGAAQPRATGRLLGGYGVKFSSAPADQYDSYRTYSPRRP